MRIPERRPALVAFLTAAAWISLLGVLSAEPRCVIFCIGDGMGFEQVKAGGMYLYGDPGTLCFESFEHAGQVTTYSADNSVTDSAAAGTALATGFKVNNGVVSMAYPGDGHEYETLLERFKSHGKRTGLVTTTYMTHATPATFGAHESSRDRYNQIAADYLGQTQPNVLLGGGANGLTVGDAQAAGYWVVADAAALLALDMSAVAMVSGQFGSTYLPYEYDGLGDLPHLSQMTASALDLLEEDPDGFFLMVEGGLVDQACHALDIARATREVVEFHNAVNTVIAWAQGRTDTLVIVTADHETGGLTVTNNGQGNYPTAPWTTTGHTGADVPIFAWGVNASFVSGVLNNTDLFAIVTFTLEASEPVPASGATGADIEGDLSWRPGDAAASHDVYFGDSPSPPFAATVTVASFDPGTLAPGTTYYWAVDERDAGGTVTPREEVWSFTTAVAPAPAADPSPADLAIDVPINPMLAWSPSAGATAYDLYLGEEGSGLALVSAGQAGTTYDPGILSPSTSYSWRVDARGPGGATTGALWSFTTGTSAAPIDAFAEAETTAQGTRTGDLTATFESDGTYEALREVLAAGGKKSVLSHTWSFTATPGHAVTFFLEAHHNADFQVDHFLFAYSTDNVTFTPMVTVTKTADDDGYQTFALPPALEGTVYVRVTDTDATRGNTALDTVFVDRMFIRTVEVEGPPSPATSPSPASGAVDVAADVVLSWLPGDAALSHDVYFGTAPDLGPEDFRGNGTAPEFDPGDLAASTTYYWRVDEVNGAGTTAGSVWSFTTAAECIPAAIHVDSIVPGVVRFGSSYKGSVRVTVLDNCGSAVSGATVTGAFTGTYNETVSAATGSDGVAVLVTTGTSKKPSYTITVTDISHPTLAYDPSANVETSDSY
jgi:alkaline phosphatase